MNMRTLIFVEKFLGGVKLSILHLELIKNLNMIKKFGHKFALLELSTPMQQGAGRIDNFYQNAIRMKNDLML